MKSEVLRLRIAPDLKEKVFAQAEAENRTVSNWVENLIRKELGKEYRRKEDQDENL